MMYSVYPKKPAKEEAMSREEEILEIIKKMTPSETDVNLKGENGKPSREFKEKADCLSFIYYDKQGGKIPCIFSC